MCIFPTLYTYIYIIIHDQICAFQSPHFRTIYFPRYMQFFFLKSLICFSRSRRLLLFNYKRFPYPHTLFIKSICIVNTNVTGASLLCPHSPSKIAPINGDILSRLFMPFASKIPTIPLSLKPRSDQVSRSRS